MCTQISKYATRASLLDVLHILVDANLEYTKNQEDSHGGVAGEVEHLLLQRIAADNQN